MTIGSIPMEPKNRWYHDLAYIFGGMFLANALPHLVNGIAGSPFQSPFAVPTDEGLSSSTVNVLWAFGNLAIAYLLVLRIGRFDPRRTRHMAALGVGALGTAVLLARHFGQFHGGLR